ncbi:hypothetical protein CHS0354_008481 [Potamilus streckersoni]|uniref:Uncharacterized protein n=1 Tax=Potamilus streckersoni TaxID=2493646 RepID=A0AAE0RPZ5_9BIVA|nr:hypothetical protein CHS0354_008481 [Potamilus streckersoni]
MEADLEVPINSHNVSNMTLSNRKAGKVVEPSNTIKIPKKKSTSTTNGMMQINITIRNITIRNAEYITRYFLLNHNLAVQI